MKNILKNNICHWPNGSQPYRNNKVSLSADGGKPEYYRMSKLFFASKPEMEETMVT
jgi:hypothetical protein